MTTILRKLEEVKIGDMEPLMIGKQIVGEVRNLTQETETNKKGQKVTYYKGLLCDEQNCIALKLVKDKVIPIKNGVVIRLYNFRTKFFNDDKIYIAIDKYGNVVEDKSITFKTVNTTSNISNDTWEPLNPKENKEQ